MKWVLNLIESIAFFGLFAVFWTELVFIVHHEFVELLLVVLRFFVNLALASGNVVVQDLVSKHDHVVFLLYPRYKWTYFCPLVFHP